MKNPFSLSDEQLKELLDSFTMWYKKNPDEEQYSEDFRQRSADLKKTLLNRGYLAKVADKELAQAIYDFSRSLEGPAIIRLGRPRIKGRLKLIKRNLHYIIDPSGDPFKKAADVLHGKHRIEIFSKAFWSPILQAQYPDLLPNWNNKTENFLAKVGVTIRTSKLSVEEKYHLISDAFLYLKDLDSRHDFFTLNHLMHYGTIVSEGVVLVEKLTSKMDSQREEYQRVSYWRVILPLDTKDRSVWPTCRSRNMIALGYDENPEAPDVKYMENSMKIGDKVVAYLERKRVGGIGTIIGEYEDYDTERPKDKDYFDGKFWRRRKVRWDHLPENADFWLIKHKIPGSRRTVYQLQKMDFERVLKSVGIKPTPAAAQVRESGEVMVSAGTTMFMPRTFELLSELHNNATRVFYLEKKEEFKTYVEKPLQELMHLVAAILPKTITSTMETEKGVFSRIPKNDFGKGGAWDFYWGAFYPKGAYRVEEAQLFVVINSESLQFGFHIGDYGIQQKKKFLNNVAAHREALSAILKENIPDDLFYSKAPNVVDGTTVESAAGQKQTMDYWLEHLKQKEITIADILSKEEVLQKNPTDLIRKITQTFEKLYPLVLLTISDSPLPQINEYLEIEDEVELNEEYTLSQCAVDTGVDENVLANWVRAIERKGQVIFYGPPGTGKTYIAEKLARHLISNGDGFIELIQFHPAYAYEDFIQGIRPKRTGEGQLDYSLQQGRLLDFIDKARSCRDRCVLIIDEINRANLARVFGELMYLLEYREREVPLAGGRMLKMPKNVRILGTMNTADRSIALVDHALRRRFAFLALYPQYDILRNFHVNTGFPVEKLINVLLRLNKQIDDRHYEVGITFFLHKNLLEQIHDIWQMEIEPYLEEYFFDQRDKVEQFRWDKIRTEILG